VDTYGKNSFAQTHMAKSRDMIHTISRYYSNAFADADKQNAMNLFLGVFEPSLCGFNLSELEKDCYLHDKFIMAPWLLSKNYIEWINKKVFKCLPFSYEQGKFWCFRIQIEFFKRVIRLSLLQRIRFWIMQCTWS